MKERLSDGISYVDDNGDVLPLPSPEDPTDTIRTAQEVLVDAWYDGVQSACEGGDFAPRNGLLAQTCSAVARYNRTGGVVRLKKDGVSVNHIAGHDTAETRHLRERTKALELARAACAACPLSDYCDFTPEALVDGIDSSQDDQEAADARSRLRTRAEQGRTLFCDTAMRPGRIPRGTIA